MQSKSLTIALLIIGALMILYSGFYYVTTEEVVDLGPVTLNREKKHSVQWPPVIGVVLFIGGILMLFRNKKKSI